MPSIHLLDSRSWDDRAQYALDLAVAAREAGLGADRFVLTSDSPLEPHFRQAGFEVSRFRLTGWLGFVGVASLGNMLREAASAGWTAINLHTPALANAASGAADIAGRGRLKLIYTDHTPAATAADPALRKSLGLFDEVVDATAAVSFFQSCLPLRGCGAEPLRIIAVGPIERGSGTDILVEAMTLLDNPGRFRLTIAGEGEGRVVMPLLRRLRKAHLEGSVVEMAGNVVVTDSLLDAADLAVAPSRAPEGSAAIARRMLRRGVPLLAADTPSHRALAAGYPGGVTLYDPANPHALASLIAGRAAK